MSNEGRDLVERIDATCMTVPLLAEARDEIMRKDAALRDILYHAEEFHYHHLIAACARRALGDPHA